MRCLLLLAAAAAAQQRVVRQGAFEDLLSWFRARCVDAGGFAVGGLSLRPGGIRNVFLPHGAKKGDALLRIPRACLLSHKETRGYLEAYGLDQAFEKCEDQCSSTEPLRAPHATSVWLMAARKEPTHAFAPYFDVFPDDLGNFPVAWDDARLQGTLPPFVAERIVHMKVHFEDLWASLKVLVPDLEEKYGRPEPPLQRRRADARDGPRRRFLPHVRLVQLTNKPLAPAAEARGLRRVERHPARHARERAVAMPLPRVGLGGGPADQPRGNRPLRAMRVGDLRRLAKAALA